MHATLSGDDEPQHVSRNRCGSVACPDRQPGGAGTRRMPHPNAELSQQSRERVRRERRNDVAASEADGGPRQAGTDDFEDSARRKVV